MKIVINHILLIFLTTVNVVSISFPDTLTFRKIELHGFNSTDEAVKAIAAITDAVGLKQNFKTSPARVDNAAAVILNKHRFIHYNPSFKRAIDKAFETDWTAVSILTREESKIESD